SLLWPGDRAWRQSGDRRMLCGLQLPGLNNQQQAFKGKVAEIDQSKVWPAGTCLGIDPTTNQPTDIPNDCSGPHAMEVTGSVNLAEKFPGPQLPAESDQDAFIKDSCTKMTDAYLAPVALRATTLTLIYSTISLPSWMAGSHQVACSIGATLGNGGWATLVGSAKGQLLINGQPPVAPPDLPDERLLMPPIPLDLSQIPTQTQVTSTQPGSTAGSTSDPATQTQHLPNAPGPQTAPGSQGPASQTQTQTQTTNTFNGPPPEDSPAPPLGAPPPEQAPAGPPPPAEGPPPPPPPPPGG
ncbi:MAG: septum formation family protein, partial [Mycobacteriaceae bacterium]|nr:septum formation family protein [Mycobacteriaceae bacterium]